MTFDDLLNRLWFFDAESFAHDSLFVFKKYTTREEYVAHNCSANELQQFIDKNNPILCGYNSNGYDKYILKFWLAGATPEELRELSDYIVGGGNGWEVPCENVKLPIIWDLMPCIVPRKSLKELEGNLGLNITETTIPFDLKTKWTEEQFQEVLYYCRCDVDALFPIFEMLKLKYQAKFVIAKVGKMDPAETLGMTDANITAKLLNATQHTYNDWFKYQYPKEVQKEKIPKEALAYFDNLIVHNDLNYEIDAPCLDLTTIDFQIGIGGGHAFVKEGIYKYDRGNDLKCEF
jgi:DNA polymerase